MIRLFTWVARSPKSIRTRSRSDSATRPTISGSAIWAVCAGGHPSWLEDGDDLAAAAFTERDRPEVEDLIKMWIEPEPQEHEAVGCMVLRVRASGP